MRKIIAAILIFATILSIFACSGGDKGDAISEDPTPTTSNDTGNVTDPSSDTTKPDTTLPDVTKPDSTDNDTTKPDTTKPDTTKPDTTKPETTEPSTTAPSETEPPMSGTLAEFSLGIGCIASGPYRFAAYDIDEQKLYELESEERASWSADYPGHFMIYRPDVYTVTKSEGDGYVDLMCQNKYGSAVVYTATDAGSATVISEVCKLWDSGTVIDILLIKGDGSILAEEKNVSTRKTVSFEKTVELARGDTVFLLVKYSDSNTVFGGQNCVLNKFEVYFDKHSVSTEVNIPSVTDDNIVAWATHSHDKIILNSLIDRGTVKYTVNMARSESESCQLVIKNSASSGAKAGRLVLLSEPVGSIGTSIYTLDNSETVGGLSYTDACRPYNGYHVTVKAGSALPFLIDFTTSVYTPSGDYLYVYAFVDGSGRTVAVFEITVHVWNFTMPVSSTFRTAAGLDNWLAVVLEQKENCSDPEYSELINDYYGFLLKYNLSPYHVPVNLLSDAADKYMSSSSVSFFLVPCMGNDGKLLPDDEILKYYNKLKTNPDWLRKAVFYPKDEPHTKAQVEEYNAICEHLRTLCPDIPVIAPYYTNIRWGGVLSSDDQTNHMYNNSGIWCPKLCLWDDDQAYSEFSKYVRPSKPYAERMEEKRAEGAELWTYVCNDPDDPYSQLFVDTAGQNQRLLFWQIYQRNISGFLYWGTNKWVNYHNYSNIIDPWESLDNGLADANGNKVIGEGNIFYPGAPVGADGPLPSMRLIHVRDGVDDIELFYLAEEYFGEAWVKEKTYEATASLTAFSDGDTLNKLRKEIGDALESKINQ